MLELKKMNYEDAFLQWECVSSLPEDEIYLRVLKNNVASFKVMTSNGGYVADEDQEHYLLRIKK
jgi:hypothetical protein